MLHDTPYKKAVCPPHPDRMRSTNVGARSKTPVRFGLTGVPHYKFIFRGTVEFSRLSATQNHPIKEWLSMHLTLVDTDEQRNNPLEDGAAYCLSNRRRAARKWVHLNNFSLTVWRNALTASGLSQQDKETALHVAASATQRGYSYIDNHALAILAGVNRTKTISDRLQRIRAAGLLDVERRYNKSSIHLLICPIGIDPDPLDKAVRDFPEDPK